MKNTVSIDMEKVEQLSHEHLWTWAELARHSSVTQSTLFSFKSRAAACKYDNCL